MKAPHHLQDDVFIEDPARTSNAEVQPDLLAMIARARDEFSHRPAILIATDELEDRIKQGASIEELCMTRARLQRLLPASDRELVLPLLRDTSSLVRTSLDILRDTKKPLLPSHIIQHRIHRYGDAPWLCADYHWDDGKSGITGSPHLVFIRTPEQVMEDGQNFPTTFFQDYNYFKDKEILLRLHSECLLGDTGVGQARCDCGQQYVKAMDAINEAGCGMFIYLRQEGRGIGLENKFMALEMSEGRRQGKWIDGNLNTKTAMLACGFDKADFREFQWTGRVLRGFGQFGGIKVMSDNPKKVLSLKDLGCPVEITAAAGVATTIENLTEFLAKICTGYNIPWESVIAVADEIKKLKNGKKIDQGLYDCLCQVWDYIETRAENNAPAELITMLREVRARLRKPNGSLSLNLNHN